MEKEFIITVPVENTRDSGSMTRSMGMVSFSTRTEIATKAIGGTASDPIMEFISTRTGMYTTENGETTSRKARVNYKWLPETNTKEIGRPAKRMAKVLFSL